MANTNQTIFARLAEVLNSFALELAFAEPGKDNGLLPLNNFLLQLEELCSAPGVPGEFPGAVKQAQAWVDQIFDTTAKFDAPALANFSAWHAWMSAAVEAADSGKPVAAPPTQWPGTTPVPMKDVQAAALPAPPVVVAAPAPAPTTATPLKLSLESDRELLLEFINESGEHLLNIEQGVLVLEEDPTNADTLNTIFRAFHTFKGGSGFLNLTVIKDLAHELESLLDAARQNKLALNSPIIDVILEGGDTLKKFVTEISAQLHGTNAGQPILIPTSDLIARVKAILANPEAPIPAAVLAPPPASPATAGAASSSDSGPRSDAGGQLPGPARRPSPPRQQASPARAAAATAPPAL